MYIELELDPHDFSALLEGLDYVKSRVAFKKGGSYDEKTAQLARLEALEAKLRSAAVDK